MLLLAIGHLEPLGKPRSLIVLRPARPSAFVVVGCAEDLIKITHGEAKRVEVRMPSPAHDSAASLDHLCSLALDQVGNCFAVQDSEPTVARLLCVSKKIHEGLLRTGWYAYCNRCKAYRRRRVQERRADHAWMQGARGASRSRAGW